jgi:hypothetical protein
LARSFFYNHETMATAATGSNGDRLGEVLLREGLLTREQLAAAITERLRIPTIGIGAGAGCSGQVQVITDLIGLGDFVPRHARPYAHIRESILEAASAYAADVAAGTFPGPAETVRMDDDVLADVLGRGASDRPDSSMPVGGIPLDRDL